ncbi:PP2C family protein-serine/threonine phosphatase [sulfur-oxidizing endosymbiont of Gigantopelta aegis]|uniref:PP2C family protein-serine/threonine phosphatase n=1 Tax=sulfur-oxidizing endosymbiont of Gigantopelta aegis TaxID=2794934 RepID=UPI001FE29212|nr:protein phosphatase 2C domain-containing protein [sulfur-oxidizing endosymbiont of Gigantopelta aegis]
MISSAQRTHRGYIRKQNEDSILCHPDYNMFVVADGMGGHSAGDLASQSIVEELLQLQLEEKDLQCSLDQIEAALLKANDNIHSGRLFETNKPKKYKLKHNKLSSLKLLKNPLKKKSDANKETEGEEQQQIRVAGSTVVIAYIVDDLCSCLWVGDSRLYIYRNDKLYQITKDHSLVQEMLDNGELTQDEAVLHPQSNVITRAIGVEEHLKIDINQFTIQKGDKLLLCSDGLYNELTSEIIVASLQEDKTDHIANKLLGEVLLREASDNVSIIVVEKQ